MTNGQISGELLYLSDGGIYGYCIAQVRIRDICQCAAVALIEQSSILDVLVRQPQSHIWFGLVEPRIELLLQ